jgi:hypothetical protein
MPKTFKKKNAKNKYKKRNSSLRGGGVLPPGYLDTIRKEFLPPSNEAKSVLIQKNQFITFKDQTNILLNINNPTCVTDFYNHYKTLMSNTKNVIQKLDSFLTIPQFKSINVSTTTTELPTTSADLQVSISKLFERIRYQEIRNNDEISSLKQKLTELQTLLKKYNNDFINYEPSIKYLFSPVTQSTNNSPNSVVKQVTNTSIPVVNPISVKNPVPPTNKNNSSATNSQNSNPTKPSSSFGTKAVNATGTLARVLGQSLGIPV